MFEKMKLKNQLRAVEDEIRSLEIKRSRSEASIIESLIGKTEPNEVDLKYFRKYTGEIEVLRDRLHEVTKKLEKL